VREVRPIWTSASFLVYAGGLIVLGSALAALVYLAAQYGSGAEAGWALLVLVVLYATAHALRSRGRPLAAGIFAFASVLAWGVFVALLFEWWGWSGLRGSFAHWSWSRLALWLLVLGAAWDDRRRFRFPLIRLISALVGWLFVIDLTTAGGNATAAVTLIVGLAYLLAGRVRTEPSAFWLHVVAGLLIGGSLLYWLHSGDVEWAFVGVFSALYMTLGSRLSRSSWAVLGALGLIAVATHLSIEWTSPALSGGGVVPFGGSGPGIAPPLRLAVGPRHTWAPIVTFAVLGFVLVAFGLLLRRDRVAQTVPPAE
jgi:hypothetical protein